MGLTGEGYRTGGECTVSTKVIKGIHLQPEEEVVEEALREIERSGLPIFYLEWRQLNSKGKGSYVLVHEGQLPVLIAAKRLGHEMVRCYVEGPKDPLLSSLREEKEVE